MGLPNEVNSALIGAAAAGGYQIEQSLRFDGSGPSRLTYDNTSGTNNSSSAWTLSFWMKRGSDIVTSQYGNDLHLMMWTPSGSCANTEYFLIADPNHGTTAIQNSMSFNGGGYSGNVANKQRDPSAWYHFVWRGNTGSSTNIIYINGVPVTDYNQGPSSMTSSYVNGASRWSIGDSYTGCGASPWDGYLAEVHFVDGQTLDHEDFGEFDDNGVWRPIKYTGTYGTNGYYLKFDPSATNGVGHDHSGNGHHWTASNVTTSGTGTDVLIDTPTNNFCTWNPIAKGGSSIYAPSTLSEGNLKHRYVRTGVGDYFGTANFAFPATGNYYWEVKVTNTSSYFCLIGICEQDWTWNSSPNVRYVSSDGKISNHVSDPQNNPIYTASTYGNGDVIGCAWNGTNKTLQFYKNGSAQASPVSPTITSGKTFVPCWHAADDNWEVTINCGQRDFEYSAPSGYNRLCTADLPVPTIADGSQYFNTVLWSGDESSPRSITGVGFQPDFVWIKRRNASQDHNFNDVVRGTSNVLASNRTDPENNALGYVSAFNSDGFSVSDGGSGNGEVNSGSGTYVAWNWLAANSSGSSNTNGSITSTVSANTSAGFSIVQYTGTGSNATVGHGLNVAPKMIIVKNRDEYTSWAVYHKSLGATKYFNLDQYTTAGTSSIWWNNTEPTSTVFSVGTRDETNNSSDRMIAYCFAEVEGYSKIDKYHGNSDGNGVFVYTGFTPSFIMIKGDLGQDFFISDTSRSPYNVTGKWLRPNLANSEIDDENTDGVGHDILSNGFKIRTNTYGLNRDYDYYYIAFASNPFGGDGVSPATAR